jgi:hypothetical protein
MVFPLRPFSFVPLQKESATPSYSLITSVAMENIFEPRKGPPVWPTLLPEKHKAEAMDKALLVLMSYYGFSDGKAAAAARKRLDACYLQYRRDPGERMDWLSPSFLAPWTEKEQNEESPDNKDWRRLYWTDTLRPALTEPTFFAELKKVQVKKQDARYDTNDRDEAIKSLEEGLVYFDTHFGTTH